MKNFIGSKRTRIFEFFVMMLIFLATCVVLFAAEKVYAAEATVIPSEEVSTENVPIENVRLLSNCAEQIRPNETVSFSVELTPNYAIETAKKVEYLIVQGFNLVTQNDNIFIVKEDATIGGILEVKALVDGIESNSLTFTIIETPIKEINILNNETKICQNGTLQLNTEILPSDATNNNLHYSIINGEEYAKISLDGLITVKNNLPRGNLTITVRAEAISNSQIYAEKSFELYVPTRSLIIKASNPFPSVGESISLYTITDATASGSDSEFSVSEHDKKYVKSLDGNILTIADEISDSNPTITISYARDGISENITLEIYIPAIALRFEDPITTIKQGGMQQFNVVSTPTNATLKYLEFSLSNYDNADITQDGLFTALIHPEKLSETVNVIAKVGEAIASTVITIVRPNVILSADRQNPITSSFSSQTVALTTEVDGVVKYSGLTYIVKSGEKFIEDEIKSDGTFSIAKGIIDYDPEIILAVTYGSWESNEIIIRPTILVESLSVENDSIVFVEQQKNYSFKGVSYPYNATKAGDDLIYSINVPSSIAAISDKGILSVSANAPIGAPIILTINGPDGTSIMHTVSVKTVYATELRLESVSNQNNIEISKNGTVYPGDILTFEASFPEPFNVTETQKVYSVEYSSGNDIATFSGITATIKPQSQISDINPHITFKVTSMQNDNILVQYFTVYVHIYVTDIEVTKLVGYVNEGALLALSDIVDAVATPYNSTIRDITYEISGNATILGKYVLVDDNLTSGNLNFTLYLSAEDVSVAPLTFNIYVGAKDINLSVDKTNPLTQKSGGENVKVTIIKDVSATDEINLKIVQGANLIEGNYSDNDTLLITYNQNGEGLFNFKVKSSTQIGSDKLIRFKASQGEITKSIDVLIYKPIEDFYVATQKMEGNTRYVDRGEENTLIITYTAYASETNKWTVDIGQIKANNRSNPVIEVPKTSTAGTTYTATFQTNDRLNKKFTFTFTVDKLDSSKFKFVNNNYRYSDYPYTKDSAGYSISKTTPELWVGRSTDIIVSYNGYPLIKYGMSISNLTCSSGFVSGSQYAQMSILPRKENELDEIVQLKINNDASGKGVVLPKIIIQDGEATYNVILDAINVFRPISGTPSLLNGYVYSSADKLVLGAGGFDMSASCDLDAFVFYVSKQSGAELQSERSLRIINDNAKAYQTIKLTTQKADGTYTQSYNGVGVYYEVSITKKLVKRVTLNKQGGRNGTDDICAFNGRSTSIIKPTRDGYIFGGYYTSTNGNGTCYYDQDGNLKVTHSNYSNVSTLYAKWTPITYYVIFYYHNGQSIVPVHFDDGTTGDSKMTCTYGVKYTIKNYTVTGGKFNHWEINNATYSNGEQPTNLEEPWFMNLTYNPNETVKFVGYCDWNRCVASGSVVTLANGTFKAVEDLDGTERLKVWNLLKGEYDTAPILFIDNDGLKTYEVVRLGFSDGTQVEIIDNHGFFDINLQKYVFISKDSKNYIGHWFITNEGKAQLVSIDTYEKRTVSYSPVTFGYLCYFVNGLLSMPANTEPFINIFNINPETMAIDKADYESDLAQYGLYTYDTFIADFNEYLNVSGQEVTLAETYALLPQIMYKAFGGQYLKVSLGKGNTTWTELSILIEQYSRQLTGGNNE